MNARTFLKSAGLVAIFCLAAASGYAANTWTNNTGNWSASTNWNALPANNGTADAILANPAGIDTITLDANWSINSLTFNGVTNATLNNSGGSVLSIGSGGITNTGTGTMTLSAPLMFTTADSRITTEYMGSALMYTFFAGSVGSSASGGTLVHVRTVGWPREFKPSTGMSTTTNVTWSLESGAFAIYAADPNVLGSNAIKITGNGTNTRGVAIYAATPSNHLYFDTPVEIDATTLSHAKRFDFIGGASLSGGSTSLITHVRGKWTLVNGVITNTSGIGPIWLNGILDSRCKVYYEANNSGLAHQAAVGDNAWAGDVFIYNGHHVINSSNAFGAGNDLFFNLGDQSGGVSSTTNRSLLATSGNNVAAGIRIYGGSADSGGNRLMATVGLEGAGAVEFSGKILLDRWATANAARAHNLYLTAPSNGTLTVSGVIGESSVNGTNSAGNANITGGGVVKLTAANTYTNTTTVMSNTTLRLDGSVKSIVTVAAGSTLQGTGTVKQSLIVSGNVAPGNGIGILTVETNATFQSGSKVTIELSASNDTSDRLNVSNTMDIANATLYLTGGIEDGSYAIAGYGTRTGSAFLSINTNGLTSGISSPVLSYGTGTNDVILLVIGNKLTVAFQTDGTAGSSLTGTALQKVVSGASCTAVTANAPTGWNFVKWKRGGTDYSTNQTLTVTNVTQMMTLTATFAANQYTLTYTAGANGTISGTTTQTVNHGASGTSVTAVPNANCHFVQWSDGLTTTNRTDASVTNNVAVTASFAINTYTVTYLAGANGTISGVTTQTVNYGANASTVTPVGNSGYQFFSWNDYSQSNPRTDASVTNNVAVTAIFGPVAPAGTTTFVTNLLSKAAIPPPADPFIEIFAQPEDDAYNYGFQTHGVMTLAHWVSVFNHIGHLSAFVSVQPYWNMTWTTKSSMSNGLVAAESVGRRTAGCIMGLPTIPSEEARTRALYSDIHGLNMAYYFHDSEEEMGDQFAGGGGYGRLRGATMAQNMTNDTPMYTAASTDFNCATNGRMRSFTVSFGFFAGSDVSGNWPYTRLATSGDTTNGWRIDYASGGWQGTNVMRFTTYRDGVSQMAESPSWPYAEAAYWRTITVTATTNSGDPTKLDAQVKVESAEPYALYTRTTTVNRPNMPASNQLFILTTLGQSAVYMNRDIDDFLLKDYTGTTIASYDFEPAVPGEILATVPIGTVTDLSGLGHSLFTPAGAENNFVRWPTHGISPDLKVKMGHWLVDELLAARATNSVPAPKVINNWRISESPGRLTAWRTEGFTHGGSEAYWLNPTLTTNENKVIKLARRGSLPTQYAWEDSTNWSQLWLGTEYRTNAPAASDYDDLITLQVLQGVRWFEVFTPMSFGHLGSQTLDFTDPVGMANINADAIYNMCLAASWFQSTSVGLAASLRTEEKYGDPAIGSDTLYIRRDNATTKEAWFAAIKVAGSSSYPVSLPTQQGTVRNLKTGTTTAITNGVFSLPLTQAAEPYHFLAKYTLTYTVGTNGTLTGTTSQTVDQGANGTAVTAVPNAGYFFDGWSDGVTENPRTDLNVSSNVTATANFAAYTGSVITFGSSITSTVSTVVSGNQIIVTAVVTNTSPTEYGQLRSFNLPTLTLGTNAWAYDFSGSGVLVPLSTANGNEQLGLTYPSCYSPVLVVKSGNSFIGFSFHYPVLDYKHNSKFAIQYAGGGKWTPIHLTTFFDYVSYPTGAYHAVSAILPPGATRTYKMVITTGTTLAEVLQPYKSYFDSLYPGGVQYARDLAPSTAISLAASDTPGYPAANPYGWYSNYTNANTLGFEAVVKPEVLKIIRGDAGDYNSGNDSFLIWAPTGATVPPELNYSFHFTTRWSAFTGGVTGTVSALQTVLSPARRMGLWWGHSLEYQPNWTGTTGRAEFDWTNPTHRAAGHAEMTNAIAAGATFIGLDACAHGLGIHPTDPSITDGLNQLWYFLPWIQELKTTYPSVKFITELMSSDILHREAAGFMQYWWGTTKYIRGRHLLADILLPGSEIIASMQFNSGETAEPELWGGLPYWHASNEVVRLSTVKTAIDYGFVPVVFYSGMGLNDDLGHNNVAYTAGTNGTLTGTASQSVSYGAHSVAVTATPNTGYHFVQWSDGSTTNPRRDIAVTSNITVTANYAINTYSLTYTAGTNGTISGTSPQTVNHGADGTAVTAVASTDYHFVNWSDSSTSNPRTDSNVTNAITVTANFAINQYSLTYTAGAGGSLTGSASQTVPYGGSAAAVLAVPDRGCHFVKWSLNGQDYSSGNPLTVTNVTQAMSFTANFNSMPQITRIEKNAAGFFTLTWNSTGGFRYRVQYANGLNGGAYEESFTDIVRSAEEETDPAAPGAPGTMEFTDDLTRTGGAPPQGARYYRIKFVPTCTLTYTAGANGTLTGSTTQSVAYGDKGTAVTAVANTGYHYVDWSDGSTANPRTDLNVTGAITVAANFAINEYSLTYTAGADGTLTGSTSQTVNYGANGTAVTAVPNTGYHFVNWSDSSTSNPRTDSNVTNAITVTAHFAINTYSLTYTAGANGTISGTTPQTVNHGANGTAVTAVPDTGYDFINWSDGPVANPRTDLNVTGIITGVANFAAKPVYWTLQDFLSIVQPFQHTHAQAAGFTPLMGWAFPETPNYWGEAVTQRGDGTLQTKWSSYWSRHYVPWINLRGLPDAQYPGLMTNAIAAALTFQDLGIPIHLFIDPWKWYMALASIQQFPAWGHAPYDFWPQAGVVDGRPIWWTDSGGIRIHPVFPWSINADAYDSMVNTLQTFKNGGIANASVGGAWSDYETLPGPFDGELEWQREWCLANPTTGPFVNPYDALIAEYAGGNATLFWTGLSGPFAQYCWDLRWSQVAGGILQPVLDVFGTGPIFGEYDDRWSSSASPTYDENNFPYRVNIAPTGVGMPSCYALNAFLTPYLGGAGKPAFNQANADAVYWFLMLRTASGSVANAPAAGRHVFWVSSDCRDSDNPTNQYGMTRALYREFLRHLFLRGASGTVTFAHEGTGADIALPMYEDARWVLDEMLSYRLYLQDLPSTSTAHKVLNAAYAPVFDTGPVWSGMANTSITTGDRWLVRVVSMSGAATNLTITPEPSLAGTQFTLPAPPDGATYLLNTAGTSTRTDTRPAGAYLKLDGNYADSSAHHLAVSGWKTGTDSVFPSFTNTLPGASLIAAEYGLYCNQTNVSAVRLSGPSSSRSAGNYVSIPNTGNVFNDVTFTVEGWVFITGPEDYSSLFSKGLDASSAANWDWQIQYRTGGNVRCLFASSDGTSSGWVETSDPSLTPNVWHHVAMVCDSQKVLLYVDHVAQAWGSMSPEGITYSGTTATLAWPIARHTGDAIQLGLFHQNFTGSIDEFRFTPEALTPLQLEHAGLLP